MIYGWLLRWLPTVILVVGIGLAAAWAVHALREQGRAELRPQIASLEAQLATETSNRQRSETVANAYLAELERLASRPVSAVPVRLCRTAPKMPAVVTAPVPDGPAAATGSDDRPAGGDLEAGPDIGPDLRGLAKACDAEIAKLRALQQWAAP